MMGQLIGAAVQLSIRQQRIFKHGAQAAGAGAVADRLVRARFEGVLGKHQLDSVQREDGGFGEDILSYRDPAFRGRGRSTPSQTAWALLAYVAAGEHRGPATAKAAEHLCAAQKPDGDWYEEEYTGTGFPLDFMIRYHLYRITFPVLALGRLRERLTR